LNEQGSVGLQRLTSSILGVDLGKTKKQAMSDWSQVPLTDAQLIYSARDAWAGAAIVTELAAVDPDTFGTAALLDLLKTEQSMEDLIHLVKSRKQAKTQLASVLKPYVPSKKRAAPRKEMPEKVKKKVRTLKRVLAETTRGGLVAFDVEPLGFKIQPKQ
jgi:ribonuclease D